MTSVELTCCVICEKANYDTRIATKFTITLGDYTAVQRNKTKRSPKQNKTKQSEIEWKILNEYIAL